MGQHQALSTCVQLQPWLCCLIKLQLVLQPGLSDCCVALAGELLHKSNPCSSFECFRNDYLTLLDKPISQWECMARLVSQCVDRSPTVIES